MLWFCRTQEEFQRWSIDMASKYGYTAEFTGLGNAIQEATALASSGIVDVGCATQVHSVGL